MVFLPDSAAMKPEDQASRESVIETIRAGIGLPVAASLTAANQVLAQYAAQGTPATPGRPVVVYRTDLGGIAWHDGTVWRGEAPGKIWVNGRDYQASGQVTVKPGSWAVSTGGWYAQTVQISVPAPAPSGYAYTVQMAATTGFTFAAAASHGGTTVYVRIAQFGSAALLSYWLVWQLVPTG